MSIYDINIAASLFQNLGIDYISCSVLEKNNERYMFTTNAEWGRYVLETWGINAYPLRSILFKLQLHTDIFEWDKIDLDEEEKNFLIKRRKMCNIITDVTVLVRNPKGFLCVTFGTSKRGTNLKSFVETYKETIANFCKLLRKDEILREFSSLSVQKTESIHYSAIPLDIKTAENTPPQHSYMIKSKATNKD